MERSHVGPLFASALLTLAGSASCAQTGSATSIVQIGGTIADVAMDPSGNTYVVGTFNGSLLLGEVSLSSIGGDGFVACLGADAQWIWATRVGGNADDGGMTVAVDPSGDLYMSAYIGSEGSSLSIGPTPVPDFPESGMAVVRMSTSGQFVWAVHANVNNLLNIRSAAADGCYFGGTAFDEVELQFGPHSVGTNETSGFLAACSADGQWLWAKEYGGSIQSSCERIMTDSSGDLIATGTFTGPTLDLDGSILTGPPLSPDDGVYFSPYLGRWSSGGEVQWLEKGDIGADGDASISSLSATPDGGYAITGTYIDSLNFGNAQLDGGAFYMAGFDGSGSCSSALDVQAFGQQFYPTDAVSLTDGTMIHVGHFSGDLQLGNNDLIGNGQIGAFLAQFSPENGWIRAESLLATGEVVLHRVLRIGEAVRVIGRFDGSMSVGGVTYLSNAGNWFIAFLSPLGVGMSEQTVTPSLELHPNPAHDRISGTMCTDPDEKLVRIFGGLGEVLIDHPTTGSMFTIDISVLPPGVYTAKAGRCTSRFVKD